MRVLGCDPGLDGIAWAVYDDGVRYFQNGCPDGDIVKWGTEVNWPGGGWQKHFPSYDRIAIETITARRTPISGMEILTAYTIGMWYARFGRERTLLIARQSIRAALCIPRGGGDRQINAMMAKLCPALNGKADGLNSHTRAAAAVAYVAYGRIPK